jgi:hypothetical protein
MGKSLLFLPNFHESPIFLSQLQNRANHIPQLFKPCILPLWSGFEGGFATVNGAFATLTAVLFFLFFIYFGWIFEKS